MGIITDPGYELWGSTCGVGWPTGHTPKKLYVSFQSITGPHVSVPWPEGPCNGIWLLEQTANPCRWEYMTARYFVTFEIQPTSTELIGGLFYPDQQMFYDRVAGNARSFFNSMPSNYVYTGGSGLVSCRPDFGSFPSIKGVAALMNIAPARKTFAEFFPKSDGNNVYKYNRKSDKTNIKFLIDPDEY